MLRRRTGSRGRRSDAASGRRRFELGAAPRPREGRRFPFRRLALTVLVATALGGSVYGASWLLLGDALRVRDVTVVGARIIDPHAASDAAALGGQSLLTLDAGAAAERVAAIPGVRAASVLRDWPRGVVIDVTEEESWGYWQAQGTRRLVSADGRVLEYARPPRDGAPTIIEVGPPHSGDVELRPDADTVRLVARLIADGAFERLRVEPEGFIFRRDRGLTILIAGGPHAVFGDSHNYEFKVASWGALLDRIEEQGLVANEIDLRFGDNLVLR
ncbi:MAG: FtsQ-type POTRA domain-containing protein [Dehalococcoidia bacterium]